MRPFNHLRTGKGFCCERCDGSYKKWRRKMKRTLKKRDRRTAKKIMEVQLLHEKTNRIIL